MSMLSEILATKRTEVSHLQRRVPLALMQERLIDAPAVRDFGAALRSADGTALIAEVKKASPSKGVIREDFDPIEIARAYESAGAACLSVLTDSTYFQGRLDYLTSIRHTVDVPLLRKDFILDPWQIVESRVAGADAILLIVAALTLDELRQLLSLANDYGMAALVEVHDRNELQEALQAGATFIGINNRDLHTFRTTLSTTLDLVATLAPDPDRLIVSESAIASRADVLMLEAAGVNAVLIGESFMREKDVAAKVREILGKVPTSA